jgi:hypothetical protein
MKTIMSTFVAAALIAGVAHAEFNPFNDPSQALPRSEQTSGDGHREALPRSSNDEFRDALPVIETFPDVVIATP